MKKVGRGRGNVLWGGEGIRKWGGREPGGKGRGEGGEGKVTYNF